MRKTLCLVGALFALTFAAGVTWQDAVDGGTISVAMPQPALERVQTDAGAFYRLGLAELTATAEFGAPDVPVVRRLIEIPFGATVTVEPRFGRFAAQALDLPLEPRQEPVPKSGPVPAYRYDAKAYGTVVEPFARVAEIAEVRGHRIAAIEVCPFRYDATSGRLEYATEFSVDVNWTGADWVRTRAAALRYDSPTFIDRLDGIVINRDAFRVDDPPALPLGYLVIVPDEWLANIQPLAQWRRQKGWNVSVRTLTQVGGGQSAQVRAFIQDAYDNWPVPPSYVLLVGDVDRIGYFTGGGTGTPPTDLNYSMVSGSDYLPDIDLARASVTSAAQLDSLVQKILTYERNEWSVGRSWLQKAYFIASSDGGNHQVAEGTHRYVMAKLRPYGVTCDSIWLYYSSGTPIVDALNTGRAWVTYSGHGSENSWADPNFTSANVRALTNVEMVPYVQTYACVSGNFASSSYPECFSETWIRSGKRGAIAHIASSVNSYWTEDDTLERRVFDWMYDSSVTYIMAAYNKAKVHYFAQMGASGMTRRYLEMYNCIGDGAIDVYWLEPAAIAVQHPPVIPVGAFSVPVGVTAGGSPVEGALVCLTARGDTTIHAAAYTDAAGNATLPITTLAPDSIVVTVTGHNLATYEGVTMALPSSGPYVIYLRSVVNDSVGGNNDGIVNPGEAIVLPTWVKNWGNAQAQDVRGWLRTTDPWATVTDSAKTFGNVGAGDSAYTGASGFGFTVAPACTNRHALRFTLVVKDSRDTTWTAPVTLVVGAPELTYSAYQPDDPPPGGNGNGMVDPGEDCDIIVTLRNVGLGNAYGVTAVLRSGDARLTVLDSTGGFGSIPRDTTGNNNADRFRIHADAAIPRETSLPCTLYISSGGATVVRSFDIGVGVIRSMDPIPDGPRTPTQYWAYDATDVMYTEAPVFEWAEINGVGMRLTLTDDQTVVVNLPTAFGPFRYYGQNYTQVSICGNGWVGLGSTTSSAYSNTALPATSLPPAFFVNWDDLYPPTGGGVWWYHDAANHRFIVEWDSVAYYSSRTTFEKNQVILYDTTLAAADGNCEAVVQYLTANGFSSSTVGEQAPGQSVFIQYAYNGDYHRGAAPLAPGMAVKYTSDPPRMQTGLVESEAGRIPARFGFARAARNPFRGTAALAYALPREARVELGVYDLGGRRVATLYSGVRPAGVHSAEWNGRDDAGRSVAQGVYFYRLDADGESVVQKTVKLQ
ncbi:MAG: C25 family cysteine peptidase [bacterium]